MLRQFFANKAMYKRLLNYTLVKQNQTQTMPNTITQLTKTGAKIGAGIGFFGGTAAAIVDSQTYNSNGRHTAIVYPTLGTTIGIASGGTLGASLGIAVAAPGVTAAVLGTTLAVCAMNNRK